MDHSTTITLLDLPDEILLMILKKLDNIDVLYSFLGVNMKLDRFARSMIFTKSLNFTKESCNEDNSSKFNRFCINILPQIEQNVQSITLDASLLERVLYIIDYPQLRKITLTNLRLELASRLMNGMFFSIMNNGKSFYQYI